MVYPTISKMRVIRLLCTVACVEVIHTSFCGKQVIVDVRRSAHVGSASLTTCWGYHVFYTLLLGVPTSVQCFCLCRRPCPRTCMFWDFEMAWFVHW